MLCISDFAGKLLRRSAWVCLAVGMPVYAQTTVSINLDFAEGKYGDTEKSTSWTMPLIIKHQIGDFSLKLNLPYVRATGTAVSGGDRFVLARQTQEGFGDVVATLTYGAVSHGASGLIIDVGAKAKLATADKLNDLLTTGKNDYSLLIDALFPIGEASIFTTLGWTKKGDPQGIDYRDPWFSTLGLSYKSSDVVAVGLIYDYRRKLTATGAPVSEASVFVERKFADQYKLQAYLVRGFSDASPDIGAGVTLSKRF